MVAHITYAMCQLQKTEQKKKKKSASRYVKHTCAHTHSRYVKQRCMHAKQNIMKHN